MGTLLGVVGLVGLVGLLLILARDDPSGDRARGVSPDEQSEASLSTTTTFEPTTSSLDASLDATTTEPPTGEPEIAFVEPGTVFVNDTPGPVLEDGIDGALVGVIAGKTMDWIDLATGETRSVELGLTIGTLNQAPWARPVVIGDELVTASGLGIRTNLVTGDQAVFALDVAERAGRFETIGQGGSDSVWLGSDTVAYEIDLSGHTLRRIELPEGFWVSWAQGEYLYLDGPDGQYRYDASTGEATETARIVNTDPMATVSCDDTLECQILVETDSGPVVLPELTGSDVSNGTIRLSPDLSGALVQRGSLSGPGYLGYVDLRTGNRVDLGRFEGDVSTGVVWLPDTRWVIVRGESSAPGPSGNLLAINTETAKTMDIEAKGPSIGFQDVFLFIDDTPA